MLDVRQNELGRRLSAVMSPRTRPPHMTSFEKQAADRDSFS